MTYLRYLDMMYLLYMGYDVSMSYNGDLDTNVSPTYIADMIYLLYMGNNVSTRYGV